jgi:hypothetical protein
MLSAAIRCIHNEFFEKSHYKEINIFVAGYGTVGKALIEILKDNRDSYCRAYREENTSCRYLEQPQICSGHRRHQIR